MEGEGRVSAVLSCGWAGEWGFLRANATARREVVLAHRAPRVPTPQLALPWPSSAGAAPPSEPVTPEPPRTKRTAWAKLLARIFKVDAETCPRCGAPMRIVELVTKHDDIQRILDSQPRGPPRRTATFLGETQLPLSFL
jgi:hypothetical protein